MQPGVLNLDLTRAVAHLGLHYAPDPSSQQACSIGGNVGTNAGGPHCLAAGVTSAHVLAVEVVLPDGSLEVLGGLDGADTAGLDLRGVFVGSEGTMGIATRIAVRLMPDPPEVRTLLADFTAIDAAAAAVSAVIAAGIVPAAMEMMDARATQAVEDFVGAGLPRDADAVLLVEVVRPARRRGRAHRGGRRTSAGSTAPATCASRSTPTSGRCCGRRASRRSARWPASRPTTTCTTPSSPGRAWSRSCARPTRSASATASSR